MSGGSNVFDAAADQFGEASGILSTIGQPGGISQGIGDFQQPGSIAQSMNSYINPFQQQVLDSAIGRITQDRDIAINQIGADAEAAGAFGGSRHGLVESELYGNVNRNIGELAGNLGLQGFNQAGMFANQDIQNQLQGLGLSGMFANQDIQNQMQAASGLSGLAGQGFGFGQAITAQQAAQGAQQQGLAQNIISGGNLQFDMLQNSPQDALNLQLAALSGNPLMGESTQSYKPGLLDFLSLGAQTMGGSKQGKFGG